MRSVIVLRIESLREVFREGCKRGDIIKRKRNSERNDSMSDTSKVLIRNARDQDLFAVAEIDAETASPYGTAERPETFQHRLRAFPNGFIILVAENEIAAYGCSEKWLTEREPRRDENCMMTHQIDGRIFCITAMAVKKKFEGRGYGSLVLEKLIEIAHNEGCRKVVLETSQSQDLYLQRGFKAVRNRTEHGTSMDVMSLDIESYGMNASAPA
jgi:ribosomal protein S18 acetylase RimI-like enzyme